MTKDSVIAKLSATDTLLLGLCKTYTREFPDPARPVSSELVSAFVPRGVRLLLLRHLVGDVLRNIQSASKVAESRSEIAAEVARLIQTYSRDLVSQIVELDSWLHEPGVAETDCMSWLIASGYQYEHALDLLTRAKKHQPGRRPTKRLYTVAALDARRLANLSWRELVAKFCDCNKIQHDERCVDALRKSAAQLELILEKYRTRPVPAEILAPLANLFLEELGWKYPSS